MGDKIYVPRAIEYSGQVISVYDPIVHSAAETAEDAPTQLRRTNRFDSRYVLCERPTVITGGELTLDMLDLDISFTGVLDTIATFESMSTRSTCAVD